jgi:hypothetical protein
LHQSFALKTCNIVGGAIIRLIGAVLLEAGDEWQLQYRYIQTEAMAELTPPTIDGASNRLAIEAVSSMYFGLYNNLQQLDGRYPKELDCEDELIYANTV